MICSELVVHTYSYSGSMQIVYTHIKIHFCDVQIIDQGKGEDNGTASSVGEAKPWP